MQDYRIVSNSLNYRVQWLGKTWILRRSKWYWLRCNSYAGSWVAEFSSESEAQTAIQDCITHKKAKKQGYIPV